MISPEPFSPLIDFPPGVQPPTPLHAIDLSPLTEPSTHPGYARILSQVQEAQQAYETLHEAPHIPEDMRPNIEARFVIQSLRNIHDFADATLRRTTAEAVKDGHISRVGAAKLLGIHQATVARWVTASEVQDWPRT